MEMRWYERRRVRRKPNPQRRRARPRRGLGCSRSGARIIPRLFALRRRRRERLGAPPPRAGRRAAPVAAGEDEKVEAPQDRGRRGGGGTAVRSWILASSKSI